jgi:hypothetical protein
MYQLFNESQKVAYSSIIVNDGSIVDKKLLRDGGFGGFDKKEKVKARESGWQGIFFLKSKKWDANLCGFYIDQLSCTPMSYCQHTTTSHHIIILFFSYSKNFI